MRPVAAQLQRHQRGRPTRSLRDPGSRTEAVVANAQRLRRIGVEIQRELADLVRGELKDPRVGMVTFTGVEVSPDLAHAKVFFTSLADPGGREATLAGLERAAGFLRSMLGARIKLHNTPELHFVYDDSVESGI